MRGFKEFCGKNQVWLVLAAAVFAVLAAALLWIFANNAVSDFFWRYYIAPVVADVEPERAGGISGDYNIINTLTYGVILALALFGIYKTMIKYEINVDARFVIAVMPFVLAGSLARALEDAHLFKAPFAYIFIAPIIYIVLGLLVFGIMLFGAFLERLKSKKKAASVLLIANISVMLVYVGAYFFAPDSFAVFMLHPLLVAALAVLSRIPIFFMLAKKEKIEATTTMLSFGLFLSLWSACLVLQWTSFGGWGSRAVRTNPEAGVYILLLAAVATLAVYAAAHFGPRMHRENPYWAPLRDKLNISMFFAQFLDASATFFGVDYMNYSEKHVLPSFAMNSIGSGLIMFPLKFAVTAMVIYLLDVKYKNELSGGGARLAGLVKLAVIILGAAPGIRDAARIVMGV